MCATDSLHAGFRQAEVLYLALANQVFHRRRHIFDGHRWVDTVLVEQVDGLDLEPFQRSFDDLPDVRQPAVKAALLAGIAVESELRRDHDFIAEGSESFTDEFLIGEGTINLSCIEEGDAFFHSRTDDGNHLLLFSSRAIAKAHAHAAEAEG